MTLTIFVPWKKGPELWQKIAPYLYGIFLALNYVIFPIVIIGVVSSVFVKDHSWNQGAKHYYPLLMYFLSLNVIRIVFAPFTVYPIIKEVYAYSKLKNDLQQLTSEELKAKLDNQHFDTEQVNIETSLIRELLQEKVHYLEQPRAFGTGDLRIGSSLELPEDIAGLMFISYINNEAIHEKFDIQKGQFRKETDESTDQPEQPTSNAINSETSESQEPLLPQSEQSKIDPKTVEVLGLKRSTIAIHAFLSEIFKAICVTVIFFQVTRQCAYYSMYYDKPLVAALFVQFICIEILHLSMIETTYHYLNMMKYILNHPYKFDNALLPFLTSLIGFLVSLIVEITNILVLL